MFLKDSIQHFPGTHPHPASVFLNGSLQKLNPNAANGGQDIDLSLPITSTYLRRMRAFGLGFDPPYQNHHHGLEVNNSIEASALAEHI